MKHFLISGLILFSVVKAGHTLAVLDFTGEGVPQASLDSLAETLRMELVRFDTLTVLDRDEMNQSLSGYSLSVCPSYDCAVVAGLILKVDFLVNTRILKVGDVYVVQSRLYEPATGRAVNTVTYDQEHSMAGLLSQGMKNVALMLMTQRIPLEVHQAKEMVYLHTEPPGATVVVGRDTLTELTPVALERVTVESKRVLVIKDQYEKFALKKLPPPEASKVIFIRLKPLNPEALKGAVAFERLIPEGVSVVADETHVRLVLKPGTSVMKNLKAGAYHLESDRYVIRNGAFKILPQRTIRLKPEFIQREALKTIRKRLKLKRNLLILASLAAAGYRGYLQYAADKNYQSYLKDTRHPEQLRTKVEDQDRLKPYMAALATISVFPAVYYQMKVIEINRLLMLP